MSEITNVNSTAFSLQMSRQAEASGQIELLRNENFALKKKLEEMTSKVAELEERLYAKAFNRHALYVGGRKND